MKRPRPAEYGDYFFDCIAPQFSEYDLGRILLPETMTKLNNWITAGYVKPHLWKDPRGGRDRRRYSIAEIFRIAIIGSLVNNIGIRPSDAAEIADFAIPFLNENRFERHPDRELKSKANLFLMSWRDRESGRVKSKTIYFKADDNAWYDDDPYLNPDAKPQGPPVGIHILLPLTDIFNGVYMDCAKYLVNNKRAELLDKYGKPIAKPGEL
jgi:hypothetical protein